MLILNYNQLNLLVAKLKNMLPLSVQMYSIGKIALKGKCDELMFIVDRWPEFTTILVRPTALKNVTFDRSEDIYIFSNNMNALLELLLEPNILPWDEPLSFASLRSHDISPVVKKVVSKKGKIVRTEVHNMAYQDPKLCNYNRMLPSGFFLGRVLPCHVPEVNSLWLDGGTKKSEQQLYKLIDRFPFLRIYTTTEDLVAFSGMNLDGSCDIGYVKPKYRGHNFFAFLNNEMASVLKNDDCIFGLISVSNPAAASNLQKIGINILKEVQYEWVSYLPKHMEQFVSKL